LAARYEEFLSAGVRLAAIDVDSSSQHAAMVDKLDLPFPYLSDPDRSLAIDPYGLSNPNDARNLAYPAIVLIDTNGDEQWRWVSRDFADRIPEDEVVSAARSLGLAPTTQAPPEVGPAEPGPKAMPFDGLGLYLRGARFAALAMGLRHGHFDESIKDDSKAYVAEMDRFIEAYTSLKERRAGD
jgi:hypothetical protein